MARKSRSRRESRPRLSEAQLQAYRTSRVAREAEGSAEDTGAATELARPVSAWGRVDEEYAMIRADLVRLTMITGLTLAILAGLWFVLG